MIPLLIDCVKIDFHSAAEVDTSKCTWQQVFQIQTGRLGPNQFWGYGQQMAPVDKRLKKLILTHPGGVSFNRCKCSW